MGELQGELRRLTGTDLDAQGAANVWAGTEDLDLVGALNERAGTSGLELAGALVACGGVGDPNGALAGVESVVEQAAWAIDARVGPSDLIGAADPTPMAGSLIDPADGSVQVVSLLIDEVAFDGSAASASMLFSADSAALSITGDIDIRASMAGIDDLTNGGSVPQKIMVSKFIADPFQTDWQLSIDLDGDPRFTWAPTGAPPLEAVEVAGTVDPYSGDAYRITRVTSTGVVTAYVEDPAGAVTTADGRTWTSLGTASSTTGALSDTVGSTLSFMIGKGVGHWCQVYDGIDGDLVVDMDIERDATAGLTVGETFTAATGETWTLGAACATFGVDRKAWVVGSTVTSDGVFIVADADAIDIGTGDFTVACVYEPSTLDAGTFRQVFAKMNPATIGTTGVGWGFVDYSPLGGLGFAINDGGGLESGAFTTWTAGERHLLVATGDRDGLLSLYVDDMTTPAVTTDISDTTDTLANTNDITISSTDPALLGAAAIWDRLLTADELRLLPYLWGVA